MTFEQRYEQLKPMIFAIIRQLNLYKDVEDYAQIGAIALWEAYEQHTEENGAFEPFAYTVIRRAMIDELRKRVRFDDQTVLIEKEETLDALEETHFSFEQLVTSYDTVQAIMQQLTDEEKTLLYEQYVNERPNEWLARQFDVSIEAVKKRKYRLKKKMQRLAKQKTM